MLQEREVNVIASIAACTVGVMTSLLLLVILYRNKRTRGMTDRMTNLLISSNVHYVQLAEIITDHGQQRIKHKTYSHSIVGTKLS